MRYHYIPTRMAKVKTLLIPIACEGMRQQNSHFIAAENAKWPSYFRRQFVAFYKLYIIFHKGPAISLLDIYPTSLKTCNTQNPTWDITRLFIITKLAETKISFNKMSEKKE